MWLVFFASQFPIAIQCSRKYLIISLRSIVSVMIRQLNFTYILQKIQALHMYDDFGTWFTLNSSYLGWTSSMRPIHHPGGAGGWFCGLWFGAASARRDQQVIECHLAYWGTTVLDFRKMIDLKGCLEILEDHPMTCKWLITMVIVSPLTGVNSPFKWPKMAYKWGVLTTY